MNNDTSIKAVNERISFTRRSRDAYALGSFVTLGTGAVITAGGIVSINPTSIVVGVTDLGCGVLTTMGFLHQKRTVKDLQLMKSFLESNPDAYIAGTKKEFFNQLNEDEKLIKDKQKVK